MTRAFSRRAFNQPIALRPSAYPLSSQGAPNPVMPPAGFSYLANVQPIGGRGNWQGGPSSLGGMGGGVPQAVTAYEIRLPYDPDDAAITSLRIGDQIDWYAADGATVVGVLTVQGTANNVGGWCKIWLIRCEQVQS